MNTSATFLSQHSIAATDAIATTRPSRTVTSTDSRYLSQIQSFTLLERKQELDLTTLWYEHGDRGAADQLINSHLRLAARIAMRYRGYGLPMAEIVSEGNVGLMQALARFEPTKGFRFSTYAVWWIRSSIHAYILRSWSLVKMGTTAGQKRLFFKLRAAKSKISALDGGDLRPDQVCQIAADLGVTRRDVIDMNRRLAGDMSLNLVVSEEGQSGERQDYLVDQSPSPEALLADRDEIDHRRSAMLAAINTLNERERRIFKARYLMEAPIKLEDLAHEFSVSRERVRQIERKAFEKVRFITRQQAADLY